MVTIITIVDSQLKLLKFTSLSSLSLEPEKEWFTFCEAHFFTWKCRDNARSISYCRIGIELFGHIWCAVWCGDAESIALEQCWLKLKWVSHWIIAPRPNNNNSPVALLPFAVNSASHDYCSLRALRVVALSSMSFLFSFSRSNQNRNNDLKMERLK